MIRGGCVLRSAPLATPNGGPLIFFSAPLWIALKEGNGGSKCTKGVGPVGAREIVLTVKEASAYLDFFGCECEYPSPLWKGEHAKNIK